MTTKDIQQVSLDIMKDIHNFCQLHGINYSLAYGTLLGAVRHKGFIPWDDDIDLFMTRPDYDRFCKEYQAHDGLSLMVYPQSMLPFARVCDTKRTHVDDGRCYWTKEKHGVWVDIFPIDGAEDSQEQLEKRFAKADKYRNLSLAYRSTKMKLSECKGNMEKLKVIVKRILFCFYSPVPQTLKILMECDYDKCSYVTNLSCPDSWGVEHFKKELFESYTTLPFEGQELCVIKDYHKVLQDYYGDYMQLPPVEQRVSKHSVYKYYWR